MCVAMRKRTIWISHHEDAVRASSEVRQVSGPERYSARPGELVADEPESSSAKGGSNPAAPRQIVLEFGDYRQPRGDSSGTPGNHAPSTANGRSENSTAHRRY